ncbi:uncharacterized protein MONBRDRAFT_32549 [Monosiga brevicollis MX1]|uniref:Mitochondrial carrier protein n=1 Tax=Monosiga brevicollis TaxID=81824 RepID=A9V090_MONBE|nr:uncharacterized protein MONBRDRAFT_32549 [Monosiga brevicollis MX1]EDQ89116.1 predicted protein [Monosiga brevicollis MX1]|eukprot:XP_001746221.1 hypothetical protein [Monosiga brevicollis MX1]
MLRLEQDKEAGLVILQGEHVERDQAMESDPNWKMDKQDRGKGGSRDIVNFIASSLGPALTAVITNPIEVVKVNQQMAGELSRQRGQHFVATLLAIRGAGGWTALQAGVHASMLREGSKNLFRIGCYQPILDFLRGEESRTQVAVWKRLLAGACSGSISAYICNPLDLIKTRIQAGKSATLGEACRQTGASDWSKWYKLWSGCHVNAARSALSTSANLPAYTLTKEALLRHGWQNAIPAHMLSGLVAGFATCVACNPVDVVRSRLYNQGGEGGQGRRLYASGWDAAVKMIRHESPLAFYKGFWAHYLRAGPHFLLAFTLIEQIRQAFRPQ